MNTRIGVILLLALLQPACKILYPPPATWFFFPVAEVSDDSFSAPDYDDLIDGCDSVLENVTVGVLRNPSRGQWNSTVEGYVKDVHVDENILLAKFLEDEGLFKRVVLVDSLGRSSEDFIISCSVECIYHIDLDEWMFVWNCLTLGIGFLIGWPHEDTSAFYVAEAIVYDNRGGEPEVVTGSLAENYKEWYCDNIWWRPSFYAGYALEPLFEQILYDFLAKSGCTAE